MVASYFQCDEAWGLDFFGQGRKISCLNSQSQPVMCNTLPILGHTYMTNEEFMHGFIPLTNTIHLHYSNINVGLNVIKALTMMDILK
jgi:hypothetical protein